MTYRRRGRRRRPRRADAGLPAVISFTVETDGRLPSGQPLGEAIEEVDAGPTERRRTSWSTAPTRRTSTTSSSPARRGRPDPRAACERLALSHASSTRPRSWTREPEELALEYVALREQLPSLTVLGGCCGTDHRHVDAMSRAGG
jgi:hypothetical protein